MILPKLSSTVFVLSCSVAALGLLASSSARAQSSVTVPLWAQCDTSDGTPQICDDVPAIPIEPIQLSELTIQLSAGVQHCSSVSLNAYVDGDLRGITTPLSPGQPSSPLALGLVAPGPHVVEIEAVGHVGGCNRGSLGTWSGELMLTSSPNTSEEIYVCDPSDGTPQVCEDGPGHDVVLDDWSDIFIDITAGSQHCADIRYGVFVDGALAHVTHWLTASETTGLVWLGSYPPGVYSVDVEAESRLGGCNVAGELTSYGVTIGLTTSLDTIEL